MTRICSRPNSREAGFTLVEVLVVIAILAGVAMLAVPAMRRQGGGVERQQAVAVLEAELVAARRNAVARAATMDVQLPEDLQYSPKLTPPLAPAGTVRFYADGSSSGGEVLSDGRPLLKIDWLSGEVRRAPTKSE